MPLLQRSGLVLHYSPCMLLDLTDNYCLAFYRYTRKSPIVFQCLLCIGVIVGFPLGQNLTVTEGIDGVISVCIEFLEGLLGRNVFVLAATSDITATGINFNVMHITY